MSATYSLSVGTSIESFRKPDINSVLLDLPDNTQKLISPKDVRDAFLSTWATSAFKNTINTSSIEYIGIDSGNPSDRDIKQKIFIGKRNYTGVDIMNNILLSNENDIYFYNTKSDISLTQSTRIAILAGTNSALHSYAPYIQSNVINSTSVSLDFINPSLFGGPINVYSSTGRVSINGILFPTISETSASASNGKILKYYGTYPNGVMKWSDPTVTVASIGTVGSVTNIYGSPSNINGYSLEFVEPSIVSQNIGGVHIGDSFPGGSFIGQNWPLSEVIRKILYPYVPPGILFNIIDITTGTKYVEVGSTSSALFSYILTRYSENIDSYQISGTTFSGQSFHAQAGSQSIGSFVYPVYSSTLPAVSQDYIFKASDTGFMTFSHSCTASVKFVSPFFHTFSMIDLQFGSPSQVGSLMNSSNKIIYPYIGSSQSISTNYSGFGYIYFLIPSTYPLLSFIKDPNGYILHDSNNLSYSSFTYSPPIMPDGIGFSQTLGLSHPYGNYVVYKTTATCSYTGSGYFEFIF